MAEASWQVFIDWNNDGSFAGAHEDVSADVRILELSGGRSRATDAFGAGTAALELENAGGRYSRYNAASPIFGSMLPGRQVLIQAVHNAVVYPRFRGELVDFEETVGEEGIPGVRFTVVDGFERLRTAVVRLALQSNKRVDQLLAAILDAAAWPAGRRNLDAGIAILPQWWAESEPALDAALEAARNELGGAFYQDRNGDMRFENRDARALSTSYATISNAVEVQLGFRRDDLIDGVVHQRAGLLVDPVESVLYELTSGARKLLPGTPPENRLSGAFAAGAASVVQPVSVTDYSANSQADGLGTDLTDRISVASFTAYGGGFDCLLENRHIGPAYLVKSRTQPGFRVRGLAIRRATDERRVEAVAPAPIVTGNVLQEEFRWNDSGDVQGLAQWRAQLLSLDRPRPVIRLLAHADAEIAAVLGIDVSRRLTLALTSGLYPPYLSGDYIVEAYQLRAPRDDDIECTVALWEREQALGRGFRISGDPGMGQDYSTIADAAGTAYDRIWF